MKTKHHHRSPNSMTMPINVTSQEGRIKTKAIGKNKRLAKATYLLVPKISDSKIFYSHREYLLSSSGAPSPRRQTRARVITRTSKNNVLLEFGCSLTLKTVKHSSDYSTSIRQYDLLAHSTTFQVGDFLFSSPEFTTSSTSDC